MKEYIISAILGTFIGYMLARFICSITNDLPYRLGYKTGEYIGKILRKYNEQN